MSAKFEGIHYGLSTTDVHVLHNGTSLFDADIDGYGGDPAFHKVQGASPTAEYSGEVVVKADETITFCGRLMAKNKTHFPTATPQVSLPRSLTIGRLRKYLYISQS